MGIAYRIDKEAGITIVVYDGIITEADTVENEQRIIADPDWPPPRKLHLSDSTTMIPDPSLPQATMAQLEEMWREQAQKMDGFKIAVVATGTFDHVSQFRPAVSPYGSSLIVFNSLETACLWLGVELDWTENILRELRLELKGCGEEPSP